MIYTEQTKKAMRLCYEAHREQLDRGGVPYVFHPWHLAESMQDEDSTVAALLHDVVEDGPYTINELRAMDFPSVAIDAVALLTHDPDEPYLEYVARVRQNPVARAVKLADLKHNGDLTRLDGIGPRERERLLKYRMAEAVLAEDRHDVVMGYWVKPIPLDLKQTGYFTVYYNAEGVRRYSVDFEFARDVHYGFTPKAAERMRPLLPAAPSLPEALVKFFTAHRHWEFPDLLRAHGIPVECFHYD